MSPSDHSLPSPRTGRTAPPDPAVSGPATPGGAASGTGAMAAVFAALGGAAMLVLLALDPVREAAPWALPLLAAGSGAVAGPGLLSVWKARRAAGRSEAPGSSARLSAAGAVPAAEEAPSAQAAEMSPGIGAEADTADTVRIAALEEALRRKDGQAARRLRSQQIAAMDSRADLACAIVHDMNNALGAVSGYADFLVSDLPAGSPNADYARRVIGAVDRTRPVLRRLVSAARMEPVPLKPERAAGVLDETANLLRAVPAAPGSLAVRHDAGTPDPVCNADLLARTLAGLAAEILFATGRSGEARLCLRASASASFPAEQDDPDADAVAAGWTVRPLLTPYPGSHTLFELRVDGAPLADDVLAALVDPLLSARACYRRGSGDREEEAHWPAAMLTARLHDGGLSLLTHPAEGTAVRLHVPAAAFPSRPSSSHASPSRFPLAAAPQPAPGPAPGPATRCIAPAYKVLVVDADPASGDRFQTGLERQGFEVSVCEDLRDALDVVADEPGFFDAVVIGPGLSALPAGVALAGRLKTLRPDLPCVLYGAAGGEFPVAAPLQTAPFQIEAGGGPADLMLPLPVDLPRLARGVAALAAGGPRRSGGTGIGDGAGDEAGMAGERR